jgi:xanthosine utilization system XapX-like protein
VAVHSPRRVALSVGAAFALALVAGLAAGGISGALDVALYAAPFLVIATLLLSGRFIGEERILAAYPALPRPRRVAPSWPRLPSRPLASALERAPWSLRGPPVVLSA